MNRVPKVAVILLNYNGLEDTLQCLESLRQIDYENLLVILVDNGSTTDPFPRATAKYPSLVTRQTGSNLGFAGGNNRGFEIALEAGAEYLLVLNNDTVVSPTIVRDLLAPFEHDSRLGILGCVINFMEEPLAVMTDGVRFNPGPHVEFFQRIAVESRREPAAVVDVDIVNGCCMMIRAEVLGRIGTFDERLFIIHEESDLCLRAQEAGYRLAVLGKSLVWHKGSSSFERSGKQLQRYFDTRNLWYLVRRYAGKTPSSQGAWRSRLHYFRYASYRYENELDAGKTTAALAVAEGLYDALVGRTGPYSQEPRPGLRLLALTLDYLRLASKAKRALVS